MDPRNVKETLLDLNWRNTMEVELKALQANKKTWSLVIPPPNANIITCRWVFKVKRNSDGSFASCKALLVARGFNQIEGLDFHDTYSPSFKFMIVRLVLSIAITHNWCLHQLNINNTFLHSDLRETVNISQPPGYKHPTKLNHICRLHLSIYGLRQSKCIWYEKL